MSHTVTYSIDLKAVGVTYPDAENTKPILEQVINHVRECYERLRDTTMKEVVIENANRQSKGLSDSLQLVPVIDYPTFDGNIDATHSFTQGLTYNEVVTVFGTVTLTTDSGDAVKLLNMIDVKGTFNINPSNRLTGY